MTPQLKIRSFTTDQFILDKVFYMNFYRLKGTKVETEKPVVVDIGAHCGYFTFAALSLGAKKVYCFEPFVDNYAVLLDNVYSKSIGKTVPHQIGVNHPLNSNFVRLKWPKIDGSQFELAYLETEGDGSFYYCPAISLDMLLFTYVPEDIDILKISIGYSESEILLTSQNLQKRVKYVCGETTMTEEQVEPFKKKMADKGFIHAYVAKIEDQEDKVLFIFGQDELSKRFNVK